MTYLKDPLAIYAASFAAIRRECDLSRFSPEEQDIVIRMVHALGEPGIVHDIRMTPDFVSSAKAALRTKHPILVDAEMVRMGITGQHPVICTLNHEAARARGIAMQTTRSAAAVDLWTDHLAGSLIAIGNAPTALFRLLELIAETNLRPSAIIGMPVGFIGAAESKEALMTGRHGLPYLTLPGRRGGTALAAAAVNALLRGLS